MIGSVEYVSKQDMQAGGVDGQTDGETDRFT